VCYSFLLSPIRRWVVVLARGLCVVAARGAFAIWGLVDAGARPSPGPAARAGVEMPLCATVYRVLYEGLPAAEAVRTLMSRPLKAEAE
jgi:hypothetical protein